MKSVQELINSFGAKKARLYLLDRFSKPEQLTMNGLSGLNKSPGGVVVGLRTIRTCLPRACREDPSLTTRFPYTRLDLGHQYYKNH